MAKKIIDFGGLSGEIPREIISEFDNSITRLGLVKKRALAAAALAFVKSDIESQMKWYVEAGRYFSTDEIPDQPDHAKHAASEIESAGRNNAGSRPQSGTRRKRA